MAAPGTVGNLVNEPCWVLLGSAIGTLTLLGYTAKGSDVVVTPGLNWIPQMAAQTGEMPLEMYENGQTMEVTVDFAEVVNWDLWQELFLAGEKQEDQATPPDNRFTSHKIADVSLVGRKGTDSAQILLLRPVELYADTTTETVRDFVIPQAVCTNLGDIPFGIETPQTVSATFTAIGDPSATDGAMLWYRGLTTADTAWAAA
jgi:hypothetical protein